ncbi:MAG: PQQ-binding-like beta-propeller repeat protein [Acidobacteria bacterium]|nr:PQQ-binding-like beta-propeller repeat protein [Acidobacteriota bacterium]
MPPRIRASRAALGTTLALIVIIIVLIEFGTAVAQSPSFVPVTDRMLQHPAADDWLMWRRTLDGWGYSPLDKIDRDNVGQLRMVWTRGLNGGFQSGTPLAYGGVLYMPNPNDVIQALDAVTGDLIWEHRREIPDDLGEYLNRALAANNRNIAIYANLIIDTSADDHLVALDAQTGRQVWETMVLDYRVNPAIQGSGPIVANGKVISGRSCSARGGPDACVVTAHDADTGAELWRRRLIPAPGEPGDDTWGEVPFEDRRHVGAWMVPSYDPGLNLIYIGTSVTSPAPKFMLGGVENSHLYHNSTLALDADTGDIVWYYQHLNDHWDLDHPFERLLVDTAVSPDPTAVSWINPRLRPGEVRQVVTGIPGKTGVVYTLDRATGEFLWATPTVAQNVISSIDGATGAVSENSEVVFTGLGQEVFTCPTWNGGKDWEAGAYSPLTNTMYMPLRNTCARMMATTTFPDDTPVGPAESRSANYAIAYRHQLTPGTTNSGTVRAISAETGDTTWLHEQRAATMSLVATGGGLVFGGDANGRFRAFDHETGDVLWEINLGSSVTGFPVTYAVDGRQYVAVSTGAGSTADHFLALTPELKPSSGNNLFVFALPE